MNILGVLRTIFIFNEPGAIWSLGATNLPSHGTGKHKCDARLQPFPLFHILIAEEWDFGVRNAG